MHKYHEVLKKLRSANTPSNREVIAAMVAAVEGKPFTRQNNETPLERANTLFWHYKEHVARRLRHSNSLIFTHNYFSLCLHRLKSEHHDTEIEHVWNEVLANLKRRSRTKIDPLPPLK